MNKSLIPNGWEVKKMRDVCDIITGVSFTGKDKQLKKNKENVACLRTANIQENLDLSSLNYINKSLTKKHQYIKKGDIVLSKYNTPALVGKSVLINKGYDMTFGAFLSVIRSKNINNNYLYYWINYCFKTGFYKHKSTGTVTIASINDNTFYDFDILYPPLEEQEKIANLLSALDNKIEINNQINKDLEELAQTLYTKWFVNFDFPNEEGKPYKSSGGEMIDSELGKIPVGWSVGKLGKVCKTLLGGTPSRKKEEYWNGDINWINSGALNEFRVSTPTEKITDLGLNKSATKLLPKGTTCIGITGNILISLLAIDSCANQSVVGILENEVLPKEYLFYNIKNRENYYKSLMSGAVQQHINKDIVDETLILIPNKVILNQYNEKVSPIFNQIVVNLFENQELKETRDLLLPYIMSGKINLN